MFEKKMHLYSLEIMLEQRAGWGAHEPLLANSGAWIVSTHGRAVGMCKLYTNATMFVCSLAILTLIGQSLVI
jgi:hypothetical protein